MPRGRQKTQYPPHLVAEVQRLYAAGHTQREIAALLDQTQKVVWRIMRNHGIAARSSAVRDQRGSANANWRGSEATYAALHYRVQALRGSPSRCSACDRTDQLRYEWANLTGRYDDPNDYVRMCVGCHRRFDTRRARKDATCEPLPLSQE